MNPDPRPQSSRPRGRKRRNSVFVNGREYSIQRRERIRGRCYFLLEKLAPLPRERWLVYDAAAGGQPRVMLFSPTNESTRQHMRVLRDLESSSLPRILDFQVDQDETRVVVPWFKGVDLQEYLNRIQKNEVAPPEPFQALRLTLELARGLRSLHCNAQVIHGDIKPSNLILTRKSSHIRLVDFGSSWPIRMTGMRAPADGISGAFAAPELKYADRIDERSDQFSASVVLYLLLTGKIPYDDLGGKAGWPEWRHDCNVAIPPSEMKLSPKHLPRKLWRQLDALALKGLDLDPGQRFAQSSDWVDAIESLFLQFQLRRHPATRETAWDRLCDWLCKRLNVGSQNNDSK